MKKKKIKKLDTLKKALRRNEAIKQGYYDGRYKPRVQENPKHKKSKNRKDQQDFGEDSQ
jgi:hypothetical protein